MKDLPAIIDELVRADTNDLVTLARMAGLDATRDFVAVDMQFADLQRADLRGIDLSGANLSRAKLAGADLREANLEGALLDGADLSGADLRNANLTGAGIFRAIMKEAKLEGARIDNGTVVKAPQTPRKTPTTVRRGAGLRQRSLREAIRATGVGLHTGAKMYFTIRPAPENTGIVFRRIDLNPVVDVPATIEHVLDEGQTTTLEYGDARVGYVDHLLAALCGLGIDNAVIDVTGPEIPIMDGSAAPFVFLIQSAGIVEQTSPKKLMQIVKPVEVREGDCWARLAPYDGYRIDLEFEVDHLTRRGVQRATLDFSTASFLREISRARTYSFKKDREALRRRDLLLGNTVVTGGDQGDIKGDLRFSDEFVRHKILDAIGYMYLSGYCLIGDLRARGANHSLLRKLLMETRSQPATWQLTALESDSDDATMVQAFGYPEKFQLS